MRPETALALTFGLVIVGGVFLIFVSLLNRTKVLEMAHRERLAMIERGLPPPTELAAPYQDASGSRSGRSSRLMSAGIVIVGFGLGIGMLIAFASREPEIAAGVGGAITILGLALIVTALVVHGGRGGSQPTWPPTAPVVNRRVPPPDPPA